ncbi:hypothetical protein BC834DRAFT_822120, partial [Gloeopeniophorella convolvens]
NPRVEPYVHYRLVLNTVGKPLNHFKSTRQLCEAIRDAIVAHSVAYKEAKILHRDVSVGNILITDSGGKGILIDWDLSKKLSINAQGRPRCMARTGTWQFISMGLLMYPTSKPHELQDDLESFFWVLSYQVIRYRSCMSSQAEDILQAAKQVFDQHAWNHSCKTITGGAGKWVCLNRGTLTYRGIGAFVETPCVDIIEDMRCILSNFYRHMEQEIETDPKARHKIEALRAKDPLVQQAKETLQCSTALLYILERHLASP